MCDPNLNEAIQVDVSVTYKLEVTGIKIFFTKTTSLQNSRI